MRSPELIVEACGPLTTVQDGGRPGWQRIGLSLAGALDSLALAVANTLVGNAAMTPAIELMLYGARLRAVGGPVRMAFAGADFPLSVDGERRPSHTSFVVPEGAVLTLAHARSGVTGILAIEGGLLVDPALGSASLHLRAELGGLDGRALTAGSRVPVTTRATHRAELMTQAVPIETGHPIRVVRGPQADHFTTATLAEFGAARFRVTSDVDRMGYRLEGQRLRARGGHNIVSDGVVRGSVQVPGSGQPIVMLAEHQTTGGYPKIATVATADLRKLVQHAPGAEIRFHFVGVDEARAALLDYYAEIAGIPQRTAPVGQSLAWLASLDRLNLAGTAIDAKDPQTWSEPDASAA